MSDQVTELRKQFVVLQRDGITQGLIVALSKAEKEVLS
jgi:hypothetical protein